MNGCYLSIRSVLLPIHPLDSGLRGEIYSAVCSLSSATSFAVSFEPFAPNRAVT